MEIKLFITQFIALFVYVVTSTQQTRSNKEGFQRELTLGPSQTFRCEDNSDDQCFPLIFYASIPEASMNKDIIITTHIKSYDYQPIDEIRGSEELEYEGTYISGNDIENLNDFDFNDIDYVINQQNDLIVNNTVLKFGMITFKSEEIQKLPGKKYIALKIINPFISYNIFSSFSINTMIYEKPANESLININFPQNEYFFFNTPKKTGFYTLTIKKNSMDHYLYVEFASKIFISQKAYFSIGNDIVNVNQTDEEIIILENDVYGQNSYLLNITTENVEYISMTVLNETIDLEKVENDKENYLNMILYKSYNDLNDRIIVNWVRNLDAFNKSHEKSTSLIKFPTITDSLNKKFKKVSYILRIYDSTVYGMDSAFVVLYTPLIVDLKPTHSYTKVFHDYQDAISEMKFHLGIGLFYFNVLAYIEDGNKIEFHSSELNFFDINYSEPFPLIIFSIIIFVILIICFIIAVISKKVYLKGSIIKDENYQQLL